MFESLSNPDTWAALFKIAVINVVLSGDNAVVIAMACRSLEPKQQRNAFLVGAGGIVVLLTVFTVFAAWLMDLSYIQVIGSVLLVWIGIKLLIPEDEGDDIEGSSNFWSAVKTIIIADMVMSLDNVLGMAGAAKGHLGMLIVGLVITMPLILFGSALLMKLMERFPVVVLGGAALLGWVAGEMAVGDHAFKTYFEAHEHMKDILEWVVPIAGLLVVVVTGKVLGYSKTKEAKALHQAGAVAESAERAGS
ncbi:MAG TPA: TerC family protein [Burkholderiales bacterium]|jgi:YjbE family integral membrane protein